MIPVTQTKVNITDSKGKLIVRGNCYAACIASLLEMTICEVPNIETLYGIKNDYYYQVLWIWLSHLGYEITGDKRFKCFHGDDELFNFRAELKDKYYIVSGKSPRGIQHACIYQNGKLIHDPHPSKEGLITEEHFEIIDKIKNEKSNKM